MYWIMYSPFRTGDNACEMDAETMTFFHKYVSHYIPGMKETGPFYASLSYMMVPGTYAEMHRDYD